MNRWFSFTPDLPLGRVLRRLVQRFTADRSGATAIQAMAMMPLILISTFGLIKAWEVVQVRESLHTGTYEAVRYLSLYPPAVASEDEWATIARRLIENELKNNPWITRTDLFANSLVIDVTFDASGEYECKMDFEMAVAFNYEMPSVKPFPGVGFHLNEKRRGEILCR